MPIELSPIISLLQNLNKTARNNCMGVGAALKRQKQIGQWTGNVLVTTLDRNLLYSLPILPISSQASRNMGIPEVTTTHRPDMIGMFYEDREGIPWCIRLDGPGLPLLQDDLFQSYSKVAILV
ncbi:MAG: hypothetical protein ACYDDP_03340 [Acidithiobacillus sp.]